MNVSFVPTSSPTSFPSTNSVNVLTLEIVTQFVATLSLFTTFFTYLLIMTSKELRTGFFSQIIGIICFCDMFCALAATLGYLPNANPWCQFQGGIFFFFYRASWLWSLLLSFQLYFLAVHKRTIGTLRLFQLIIWGICLFFEIIPFILHNQFGQDDYLSGHTLCFMAVGSGSFTTEVDYITYSFSYFLIFILFLIFIICIRMYFYIFNLKIDPNDQINPSFSSSHHAERPTQFTLDTNSIYSIEKPSELNFSHLHRSPSTASTIRTRSMNSSSSTTFSMMSSSFFSSFPSFSRPITQQQQQRHPSQSPSSPSYVSSLSPSPSSSSSSIPTNPPPPVSSSSTASSSSHVHVLELTPALSFSSDWDSNEMRLNSFENEKGKENGNNNPHPINSLNSSDSSPRISSFSTLTRSPFHSTSPDAAISSSSSSLSYPTHQNHNDNDNPSDDHSQVVIPLSFDIEMDSHLSHLPLTSQMYNNNKSNETKQQTSSTSSSSSSTFSSSIGIENKSNLTKDNLHQIQMKDQQQPSSTRLHSILINNNNNHKNNHNNNNNNNNNNNKNHQMEGVNFEDQVHHNNNLDELELGIDEKDNDEEDEEDESRLTFENYQQTVSIRSYLKLKQILLVLIQYPTLTLLLWIPSILHYYITVGGVNDNIDIDNGIKTIALWHGTLNCLIFYFNSERARIILWSRIICQKPPHPKANQKLFNNDGDQSLMDRIIRQSQAFASNARSLSIVAVATVNNQFYK